LQGALDIAYRGNEARIWTMNPALYNATFTMALVAFSVVSLFFGEMLIGPIKKVKSEK
jgi:hypothetical protein